MECEHFLYNLASIKEECETFYAEAITPSDVGSFIRSMGMTANIGYQHIRSFIVDRTTNILMRPMREEVAFGTKMTWSAIIYPLRTMRQMGRSSNT